MLLVARKPAYAAHTRRNRVGALCRRGPQRTSRKHKMRQLSFALALALCGCSSPQAVPDAATAIAIAKTQCGTANNPKTWDATLVGNIWTVHARDLDLQLFSEKTMRVTTDGQITPGCRLIPRPGRNPQRAAVSGMARPRSRARCRGQLSHPYGRGPPVRGRTLGPFAPAWPAAPARA